MKFSQAYILVLDSSRRDTQAIYTLLKQLRCPVFVAETIDQAVAKAKQCSPYLVILRGDYQEGAPGLIEQLRQTMQAAEVTIVALTESSKPSWGDHIEQLGLDGVFVEPLNGDVLNLLVDSAMAKQAYA
ncbi:hypothetical protein XM38_034980 [Halomicronema hongdechloris C2206]|uniref:Response regulatory domain-containing protein n=1 Tax=Halomicronema hongdechloris C2206 TaxID=1641165 RepID=A0A1Z3HQE7_9CYAN|nr:hypothetical protein [Halomicronema hongdechloris]ASC72540.1 hypothetical protein XM38_034980 [Halomicronema hongdechloris C2206]